jgi:ribosome modulation factor
MTRYLYAAVTLTLISVTIPVRAAKRPHAGADSQKTIVWTNDGLERLHVPGLIGIVGRTNEEAPNSAAAPAPYLETHDLGWYAGQAAKLRDELERRKAQLGGYRQAIEDARSLKTMTGGINLDDGDVGITPEAGIEILQERVSETQSALDALEDVARRNDIPPGTVRGQ